MIYLLAFRVTQEKTVRLSAAVRGCPRLSMQCPHLATEELHATEELSVIVQVLTGDRL